MESGPKSKVEQEADPHTSEAEVARERQLLDIKDLFPGLVLTAVTTFILEIGAEIVHIVPPFQVGISEVDEDRGQVVLRIESPKWGGEYPVRVEWHRHAGDFIMEAEPLDLSIVEADFPVRDRRSTRNTRKSIGSILLEPQDLKLLQKASA